MPALKLSAAKIAEIVGGIVVGNAKAEVSSVAKIEEAGESDLCFISNKKYGHHLETTQAGVVLVGPEQNGIPEGLTAIRCDQPYVAFCQILIQYFDYVEEAKGIHPTAVIEETATLGEDCYIGPNVYIGERVSIGKGSKIFANTSIYEDSSIGNDCVIKPNVSIYYNSKIGNGCLIHSGTVIGSDGFGHAPLPNGTYIKIPQIGNVVIGNGVEIGSNCSIDRANMGSTVIADGCRLDNLIQIAHGVEIGEHTVIAAQVAIAGSTKVGKHCVIGGQAGITGHIRIADYTQIGAQAGVTNNIKEDGQKYTDTPHLEVRNALKSRVLYRNLPNLEKRIKELEDIIKELKTNNG